jgi:alkanesulfonate monooxygenase SsuD/methylene tetrahydromethanopterin reductase-like flavin-dependent oxidoreductase (luciferase family)
VRLGVLVSGNAYRHPAVLAKMVTTVDHISEGRVELGLGAGWPGQNRRYGINFWKRPERLARLEEAVQVIQRLWTEPRPKFAGKYYQLDEPPYSPPNVQRPHPPVLIAGGSDPMLRTIARYADAANPMIDITEAREKIAHFCREWGRDPASIRWRGCREPHDRHHRSAREDCSLLPRMGEGPRFDSVDTGGADVPQR